MATKDSWSTSECIKLIELYRTHMVLWDTTNEFYYSALKKKDAYAEISAEMNIPVADIIKKMKSLMSSFRAQKAKGTKSVGTGKARREIYISKWFAFKHMLFLADRDKPTGTVDTIHEDLENINDESSQDEDGESDVAVEEHTTRLDDEDDYETVETILKSQGNINTTVNPGKELDDIQKEALDVAVTCESPTADNQSAKKTQLVSSVPNAKKNISRSDRSRSRRKVAENKKGDQQLDRAFELLEKAASEPAKPQYEGLGIIPDKHTTFALHVAEKLRGYSSFTVSHVQYEINKILFAADIGHYEKPSGIALIPHSQSRIPYLYGSQPSTPHSYESRSPSPLAYGSQPPTSHAYGSQPPRSHSYEPQPPTPHVYGSQPSRPHLYETQPPRPHSNESQPPTPHAYGSCPPIPHAYASHQPTSHAYGSPEQLPIPQQQNKPQTETAETDIMHTLNTF